MGKISVTVGGNSAVSGADYEVKIELVKAGGSGYDIGNSVATGASVKYLLLDPFRVQQVLVTLPYTLQAAMIFFHEI